MAFGLAIYLFDIVRYCCLLFSEGLDPLDEGRELVCGDAADFAVRALDDLFCGGCGAVDHGCRFPAMVCRTFDYSDGPGWKTGLDGSRVTRAPGLSLGRRGAACG